MTDPIADMLTRIRNAVHARHQRVDIPASRLKADIAKILESEGFISGYSNVDPSQGPDTTGDGVERPAIRLFLKYGPRGEQVITGIERVSRPGRRVYFGSKEVPRVMGGLGTTILTTSRGVMTGKEAAKAGVGGEVLCNVW
jgi:small subunit ribosomal protein S8